jgi:hypothetical protein
MGAAPLGYSNGQFSIQKCDILLIPDVVLGAGEAMRRREFLGIVGCAVTWPVALKAQSTDRVRVIGVLNLLGSDDPETEARTTVFVQTLQQLGWKLGRDLKIETRYVGRDLNLLRLLTDKILSGVSLPRTSILTLGSETDCRNVMLMSGLRCIPIITSKFR